MATGTEANRFFEQAVQVISAAKDHAIKDGILAAAGRMGIDELGAALKAFPDSIQQQETGAIWNPTQGEVAEARAEPAEPTVGLGQKPWLPSPSQIAAETKPYQQEAEQGRQRDQDQGQHR